MGNKTAQSTTGPSNGALGFLKGLTNIATQAASRPYKQYQGNRVAGFNSDQSGAFDAVRQAQGIQAPYLNAASQYAAQGAAPVQYQSFSQEGLSRFYNPYQQNVIDTTLANVNRNNALEQENLLGRAIQSGGAFGGDRAGLAAAELARSQGLARNQTIAELESQGFNTALGAYQNEAAQNLAADTTSRNLAAGAAGQFAGLGSQAQQQALTGATALLQTGGLQQQQQQNQLDINYQNFLNRTQYPQQQAQWLLNTLMGIPSNLGTTSTTPGPSTLSQIAGGIGAIGSLGLGFAEGGAVDGDDTIAGYAEGGPAYWTTPDASYGIAIPMLSYSAFSAPATTEYTPGIALPPSSFGGQPAKTYAMPAGLLRAFRRLPGLVKTKAAGGAVGDGDLFDPTPLGTLPVVRPGTLADAPSIVPSGDEATIMAVQPAAVTASPVPAVTDAPAGIAAAPAAPAPPPSEDDAAGIAAFAGRPQAGPEANRFDRFLASPAGAVFQGSLATMAGTSPFAGVNIGAGLLEGVKAYQAQKAAAAKLDANAQVITDGETIKIFYPSSGEIVDTHIPTGQTAKAPETKTVGNTLVQWNGQEWVPVATDAAATPPYAGTGMDAQNWNIILTGDPASKEYGAAYNQLFEQPRMTPVQTENGMMLVPQMPVVPDFVRRPNGAAPVVPPGAVPAPDAAAAPAVSAPAAVPDAPSPGVGNPVVIPGTTPKPTESQVRARSLYVQSLPDYEIVMRNFDSLDSTFDQIARGALGDNMSNIVTSPEYQRAFNALKFIVSNAQYIKSGANSPEEENIRNTLALMPTPFESAQSVADKKARIHAIIAGMRAAGEISSPLPDVPVVPGDPVPAQSAPAAAPAETPVVPWQDYFK